MVGSKNYLHGDHVVAAFKAGKNVFCEKPLAHSVQNCEEIRNAWKESGKNFANGFVLRSSPFYQAIHRVVSSGDLGKIVSIEANELIAPDHGGYFMRCWRRDSKQSGSYFLEKCCHDMDILNWMIGSVPSRIASFGGLNSYLPENKPEAPEDLELYHTRPVWEKNVASSFETEKDIVDNQVCILEYRNKVRVSFHTNTNIAKFQRRILILGVKGSLEADLKIGVVTVNRITTKTPDSEIIKVDGLGGTHAGNEPMVDGLVHCMTTNVPPLVSGDAAFISAVICLNMEKARKEGQIIDLEPYWRSVGI